MFENSPDVSKILSQRSDPEVGTLHGCVMPFRNVQAPFNNISNGIKIVLFIALDSRDNNHSTKMTYQLNHNTWSCCPNITPKHLHSLNCNSVNTRKFPFVFKHFPFKRLFCHCVIHVFYREYFPESQRVLFSSCTPFAAKWIPQRKICLRFSLEIKIDNRSESLWKPFSLISMTRRRKHDDLFGYAIIVSDNDN